MKVNNEIWFANVCPAYRSFRFLYISYGDPQTFTALRYCHTILGQLLNERFSVSLGSRHDLRHHFDRPSIQVCSLISLLLEQRLTCLNITQSPLQVIH